MAARIKPNSNNTSRWQGSKSSQLVWQHHGIRIAHHQHSGRFIPWHYTSYAVLYFLLLLTVFLMLFASNAAKATHETSQGSITVSGVINGPPPSTPAIITSPKDGAHVSERTISVLGDCTQDLFVELYRGNNFAGQDLCDGNDSFEIIITLLPGENKLVAKIKDGAEQYGPDSNTVFVFYDVPSTSKEGPSKDISNNNLLPFLLYTSSAVHGQVVNDKLTLTYEIDGGQSPYAISIDWGDDSKDSVFSHKSDGDFIADHTYKYGGQFTITINGSDSLQTKAVIQTIAIVYDASDAALITDVDCQPITKCLASSSFILDIINRYLWPATIVALLMTFSFWLGERFVYAESRRKPKHV